MDVTLIAAVAIGNVIGSNGQLVWRNSRDLSRVKQRTLGKTLIMGRSTFESIGRPLPGRDTLVLTRDSGWSHPGVRTFGSIALAFDELRDANLDELIVFGGGQVYTAFMPYATRLEITDAPGIHDGDTHFPAIEPTTWRITRYVVADSLAIYERRETAPARPTWA